MLVLDELTEDNLFLYAAKHYDNPTFSDIDEFYEDLKRFKYIKRLINRYLETNDTVERLILNHLVVVCNVFGIEASINILNLKLEERHWPVIKPFLVFLRYITNEQMTLVEMDKEIVERLRKI